MVMRPVAAPVYSSSLIFDLPKANYHSPIGVLEIVGTEEGILSVEFADKTPGTSQKIHSCLEECLRQLDEYFRGKRKEFSLTLLWRGTDFQLKVWKELMNIPYGQTSTYKKVAEAVGNPKAVRAVGAANRSNRFTIIIPCHRVIGSNGGLVGYGGNLWRKEWLLNHEKKYRGWP